VRRSTTAAELFGERLKELRLAAGHTQESLAEGAGLPSTHISSMERGLKLPNLMTLLRLAVALNCKVAKLVSVFDQTEIAALLEK